MANGHGGKRPGTGGKQPGAGRPKKLVTDWRAHNLARFQARFTDEDIDQITDTIKRMMRAGDKDFAKMALPYLLGAVPKELTVNSDAPLRVTIDLGRMDGNGG